MNIYSSYISSSIDENVLTLMQVTLCFRFLFFNPTEEDTKPTICQNMSDNHKLGFLAKFSA